MSGFGRKGLGDGPVVPASRGGFGNRVNEHEQLRAANARATGTFGDPGSVAAKRAAFLQSERERSARMAQADQRGISSYAESFQSSQPQPAADRPLWVAYLLWFFVGQLSAHRFYLGATSSAFKQLGLLFGSVILAFVFAPLAAIGIIAWIIWIFADLFLMPGMHRKLSQPNPSPIFS